MPKLRLKLSMSLDGFVAGPEQSVDNPLGIGGMRLHEWAFALAEWRQMHGEQGGETNASSGVVEESLANIGATILGRNGGRDGDQPRAHAPRLWGAPVRRFGPDAELRLVRTVPSPGVTHYKFARD